MLRPRHGCISDSDKSRIFLACNLPIRRPLIIESPLLVAQEEASRDCMYMYSITDYGTSTLAKSPDFLESIKVQLSEEADIAYGYVWSYSSPFFLAPHVSNTQVQ